MKVHLLPPGSGLKALAGLQVAVLRRDSAASLNVSRGAPELLADLAAVLGRLIGVDVSSIEFGHQDPAQAADELIAAGTEPWKAAAMAFGLWTCSAQDEVFIAWASRRQDKAEIAAAMNLSPRLALDSQCAAARWMESNARRVFKPSMVSQSIVHSVDRTFTRLSGVMPSIVIGERSTTSFVEGYSDSGDSPWFEVLREVPMIPLLDNAVPSEQVLGRLAPKETMKKISRLWPATLDCAEFIASIPTPPLRVPPGADITWASDAATLLSAALAIERRIKSGVSIIEGIGSIPAVQGKQGKDSVSIVEDLPPPFEAVRVDVPSELSDDPPLDIAVVLFSVLKASIESGALLADEAVVESEFIGAVIKRELAAQGKEAGPDDTYPAIFGSISAAGLSLSDALYAVDYCGLPRERALQSPLGLEVQRQRGLPFLINSS